MSNLTCINCGVRFTNAETFKEHYKTDFHRYNLKRRVAELPPITAEEFQNRLLQQKKLELENFQETSLYCTACRKQFSTQNAHENHLNSKKHKENLVKFQQEGNSNQKELTVKAVIELKQSESNIGDSTLNQMDGESDESWEEVVENPIAENNCIFCDHHSENFVENLEHMSISHSFFIPDPEYCIDLEGLLYYLAEKVCRDFICLWCNDRGKTFYSVDAVRKHMIDKGHSKMLHEGLALAEYTEFYDYSSSYPDNEEGMDIDEEFDPQLLEGDEYQLVLPSGLVIGHRSLMRYYKQRLNPNRQLTVHKSDKKLHKVLSQYKSIGWTSTQQEMAARKARDIHVMKRLHSKFIMKLGVRANKLQHHFRPQINF